MVIDVHWKYGAKLYSHPDQFYLVQLCTCSNLTKYSHFCVVLFSGFLCVFPRLTNMETCQSLKGLEHLEMPGNFSLRPTLLLHVLRIVTFSSFIVYLSCEINRKFESINGGINMLLCMKKMIYESVFTGNFVSPINGWNLKYILVLFFI